MQTFLPYPSFTQSARCLDWRRLGKQRVECKQILKALRSYPLDAMGDEERVRYLTLISDYRPNARPMPWLNHPCTQMWKEYTDALKDYHNEIIYEWVRRGYENNMPYLNLNPDREAIVPPWLGDERLHSSHRGRLLEKDYEWYSAYGWEEEPISQEQGYYWPTVSGSVVTSSTGSKNIPTQSRTLQA